MNKIAIAIPSFLRFGKLLKEVNSIFQNIKCDYKIYIADQDKITNGKKKIYEKWEEKGHRIIQMPFNCGALTARNCLIENIKEDYILVVDNDFLFTKNTDLSIFYDILQSKENIGIVGGNVDGRVNNNNDYIYDLLLKNNKLYFIYNDFKKIYTSLNSHKFIYSDVVLNFFLAKRKVFNDLMWDCKFKMFGHIDFFLRLKDTMWKTVHTNEVSVIHQTENDNDTYLNFRHGNRINSNTYNGIQYFYKKWNLNKDSFIKNQKDSTIMDYKNEYKKTIK